MRNYLNFKNEIQGFKDVLETVKTEEKISAASIHKLKIKVQTLQNFKNNLSEILQKLYQFEIHTKHPLLSSRGTGHKSLLVIGSDKGLVGGLHHNLANKYHQIKKDYTRLFVFGSKLSSFLVEDGATIEKTFHYHNDLPAEEDTRECTDYLFNEFKTGRLSKVDILFPAFLSLSEQTPIVAPFLPFDFGAERVSYTAKDKREVPIGIPIFEPGKEQIFDFFLEQYIGVYYYEIIMESKLSELSARTVSMENATGKTKEFIKNLRHVYLKERRREITQKQLESFVVHKMS